MTDVQQLLNKVLNIPTMPLDVEGVVQDGLSKPVVPVDNIRYQQYQGYAAFDSVPMLELIPGQWESDDDVNLVIRGVYRQVLGNAHIMESERLVTAESQLKSGTISVREFVRQVAKSELYRSRFFTSCYRYRAIELNFKHLLGRAPDNYQEMIPHSTILDTKGYEADIDSYLDSDEYQSAFGEHIVPYYRYKTRNGQSMLGFTNTFGLLTSASSSDKDLTAGNPPRVMTALMLNSPYGAQRGSDARSLAEDAIRQTSSSFSVTATSTFDRQEQISLTKQLEEQAQSITKLEKQLAEVRSLSSFGSSLMNQSSVRSLAIPGTSVATSVETFEDNNRSELKSKVQQQASRIEQLQGEITTANALANVASYRLNRWQKRSF